MDVLIVGSRSFIARRIRQRLQGAHDVRLAGRDPSADVHLDLESPDLPVEGLRCEVLIHCAASFEGNTQRGMVQNELVNAVGALRVAGLASQAGCRQIIHLSSTSAFDETGGRLRDSYALSKRHGQENLELHCDHAGIPLCTLCPSGVYDEVGEGRRHQPLLYRIVDCARRGEDFSLHGGTDPARNYLFVDDLAATVEGALQNKLAGTFPVLFPRDYRVREIAELAFRVFGRGGRVIPRPDLPDIREVNYPRSLEIYQRLGRSPQVDLERGFTLMNDLIGEVCSSPASAPSSAMVSSIPFA